MLRIVGFFLQKENILQLNNATWEAADQIAFLPLINCFYHDMKGPLFAQRGKFVLYTYFILGLFFGSDNKEANWDVALL